MEIKISKNIKNPIIISGFPGFGLVGSIATEFLIEHLKTEKDGDQPDDLFTLHVIRTKGTGYLLTCKPWISLERQSEPKKVPEGIATVFTSTPICFRLAWIAACSSWRSALTVVSSSTENFTGLPLQVPARMPSEPTLYPAASSN